MRGCRDVSCNNAILLVRCVKTGCEVLVSLNNRTFIADDSLLALNALSNEHLVFTRTVFFLGLECSLEKVGEVLTGALFTRTLGGH